MLDGGHQQRCIGASVVDRDVGDDPALRLLHFNARPELRRLVQLSLPNDLSPRLEEADDLAWRARLTAKNAASSLTDHLTHSRKHRLDVRDETVDPSCAIGLSSFYFAGAQPRRRDEPAWPGVP